MEINNFIIHNLTLQVSTVQMEPRMPTSSAARLEPTSLNTMQRPWMNALPALAASTVQGMATATIQESVMLAGIVLRVPTLLMGPIMEGSVNLDSTVLWVRPGDQFCPSVAPVTLSLEMDGRWFMY